MIMAKMVAAGLRFARFVSSLPEACANSLRFGVPFLLPRWFQMPSHLRVGRRTMELRFLDEAGVDADFITCVLRNTYGLGHQLAEIRTIVDVGASFGFFSLAARARYPDAAIHAYEPNPRILPLLRANAAGFDVQIHAEALGAQDGAVNLIDDGPSNQARIGALENNAPACEVLEVSLETAVKQAGGRIDLLKLDCEGAEWKILKASDGWQSVRNVRLEYHLFRGESAEDAARELSRLGFRVIRIQRYHDTGGIIWAARA